MMERLTVKWTDKVYDTLDPVDILDNEYSKTNYNKLLTKLGEYEDLEEQGLLLRLPCKVGDTVYVPHRGKIQEMIIQMVYWNGTSFFFSWTLNSGIYPWLDGFGDMNIGKTVFLTQAEAEQKLKEMEV